MQADGSFEADRERGHLALAVLDNPIYVEAHALIEAETIRLWRESRNAEDREQLHKLLLLHERHKAAMQQVVRTGEIATAELVRKQTKAERIMDAMR